VAADFDASAFAATMADAHVDSVNVFAKCHTGYSYYRPGRTVHPGLARPAGLQIALCTAAHPGAIYLSVLWDDLAASSTGTGSSPPVRRTLMRAPLSNDSPILGPDRLDHLDVSSGYGDYVVAQVGAVRGLPGGRLLVRHRLARAELLTVVPGQAARGRRGPVRRGRRARHGVRGPARLHAPGPSTVRDGAPDASVFFNGSVSARVRRTLPMQNPPGGGEPADVRC
jgi:hypothetical protein